MRINTKLFGLLVFTALLMSSCETKEKEVAVEVKKEVALDMAKIKVEIQALEDGYAAAQKAKNADAVAAYYAEDAISYGQNKQPLSGRAAIRDDIATRIAKDTTTNYNVYKVVDLFAEGDTALEIGSWTEFDADGNQKDNGNYVSYFQKRDGKYICVRDMSTTATPRKPGM